MTIVNTCCNLQQISDRSHARALLEGDPAALLAALRADSNGLLDEGLEVEENPIVHLIETATPAERAALESLAALDRENGKKPTPRT